MTANNDGLWLGSKSLQLCIAGHRLCCVFHAQWKHFWIFGHHGNHGKSRTITEKKKIMDQFGA